MSHSIDRRRSARWGSAATALLLLSSMTLSGCAVAMWNKGEFRLTRTVTFGQELRDLYQAREEGAITDEEWRALKKKVLELVDLESGLLEFAEEIPDIDSDEG